MSCRSIRPWLHAERGALGEADRLVLEEHLQTCARCRADREHLALVRRIGAAVPAGSIGPRGHGRAIARALMAGPRDPARARRGVRWGVLAIAATAAATTAVAASFVIRSGGLDTSVPAAPSEHLSVPVPAPIPERAPAPAFVRAPAPAPAPEPRQPPRIPPAAPDVALAEGALLREGMALTSGAELPADVPLRAAARARVRAYGVSVVIAANSRIRWVRAERAILLEAGSVTVEGGPARIATDRFRVDASGAVAITPRTVLVRRGSAAVTAAGGRVLAAHLGVGASWSLPEPPAPAARPSAGRLLAHARAAFARGDHAGAERAADAALDAGPSRAQAAEARTLLAECAHATGRLDDALRRYEAIADRFGDLPAGETALFAAARLEARRGRAAAARALFERYLDRYPSGRFAGDARRHTRAPAHQE